MKRLVGAVLFSLVGLAAVVWAPSGCATRQLATPQPDPRTARNYEPDGGWENYRPTGKDVSGLRDVRSNSTLNVGPVGPSTPSSSPVLSPATH
jgi:hypothetical protein